MLKVQLKIPLNIKLASEKFSFLCIRRKPTSLNSRLKHYRKPADYYASTELRLLVNSGR